MLRQFFAFIPFAVNLIFAVLWIVFRFATRTTGNPAYLDLDPISVTTLNIVLFAFNTIGWGYIFYQQLDNKP